MQNEILNRLKVPAIGLIITGILNFIWGILSIISNIYQYTNQQGVYADINAGVPFYVGVVIGIGLVVVNMIIAPIIIFGGIKMLKGQSYGLAKASAIAAFIPLISCCFISGIPFGIWALVVLLKPEVKAYFNGEISDQRFNPPQPPNFN